MILLSPLKEIQNWEVKIVIQLKDIFGSYIYIYFYLSQYCDIIIIYIIIEYH